jgi:hypothetical protein
MSLISRHSIKIFGNFLFSKTNGELLIFLFFLILSGVFWLMMTLNESYEKEVKFAVRFTNVPENVVLTSGVTDSIRVNISDKGFSLFTFLYAHQRQPVTIDFAKYSANDGSGLVSGGDLQRLIEHLLPASAKITSMKTDVLRFFYNNGERKRVPVRWQGHVKTDPHYFISKTVIVPDSVTVYATPGKLDSIKYIYTEELNYNDIHDTLTIATKLKQMRGVKVEPQEVTIHFYPDVMTEERVDSVPVIGINMPEGKVLRTFPSRVSVNIVTGMHNLRALRANDFLVVADYKEFGKNSSTSCKIKLKRIPQGIYKATLDVEQVDYLIEEKLP